MVQLPLPPPSAFLPAKTVQKINTVMLSVEMSSKLQPFRDAERKVAPPGHGPAAAQLFERDAYSKSPVKQEKKCTRMKP